MNVDIYVQKDGSALVVKAGQAIEGLSEEGRCMVRNAVDTKKNRDIDGSIVGLDRDAAKVAIANDGEFVNHATIQMTEHDKGVKILIGVIALTISSAGFCDTLIVSDSPSVVRNAEIREAIRQDSTWTSENIRANPYLFLQDQIASCDKLKAKIESQNITLVRMEKQSNRKAEEAESMITRYSKFLTDAKAAYKAAKGKWPVSVNGYDLDEDDFNDRVSDAMERVELAKKEAKDNKAISKKVSIRKGVLKTKKRELVSLRLKLVQQAEQVKMNSALAEINSLNDVLGTINDMMIEIDEDPTKLSVEDLTAEDPNAKRNKKVSAFLND